MAKLDKTSRKPFFPEDSACAFILLGIFLAIVIASILTSEGILFNG